MDVAEREIKFFMLRMFEFVYQLLCKKLPYDLQIEFHDFSIEETGYFTDSIAKALFIFMNEQNDVGEEIISPGSLYFQKASFLSALNYPLAFLEFCSCYIAKAVSDSDQNSSRFYEEVWSSIETVLQKANHNGRINPVVWDRLDEVASQIIVKNYIQCRRIPNFNPKNKLNLEDEKAFILRLMQHIFKLHFEQLPDYYNDKLRRLDVTGYHLPENVRKAIFYIMESQLVTSKYSKETDVRYWFRFSFNSFKAKEFLQFCTFFSKYAFEDYYLKKKTFTPIKVHELCVKVLQGVKEKGLTGPWNEIDSAAISILETNEVKVNASLHDFKNIRIETFETSEDATFMTSEAKIDTMTENMDSSEIVTYNSDCRCSMCSFI